MHQPPLLTSASGILGESNDQCMEFRPDLVILVVGECGDGKSTLINTLVGGDPVCEAGRSARGVTKKIQCHPVMVGKLRMHLLDTPGIGDQDINPMMLLAMIEDHLAANTTLDGVVVTSSVTDGRVKLGAQVVRTLVEKGFIADDKWRHVILNGTKADRAEEEEKEFFRTRIRDDFFHGAKLEHMTVSMTSVTNTEELVEAIERLPRSKVQYEKPNAEVMSQALAEKMGMQTDLFKKELAEMREKVEAERKERHEAERKISLEMQKAAEAKHLQAMAEERERQRFMQHEKGVEKAKQQAVLDATKARRQEKLLHRLMSDNWCFHNPLPGSWDRNTVAGLITDDCTNAFRAEVWRSNSYLGNAVTIGARNFMWHGIRVCDDKSTILKEMGQFDSGSWVYSIDAMGNKTSWTSPA